MITRERFQQLWDALVENRVSPNTSDKNDKSVLLPFVSKNGISPNLKSSLLDNSDEDGECLAMNIPGSPSWKVNY